MNYGVDWLSLLSGKDAEDMTEDQGIWCHRVLVERDGKTLYRSMTYHHISTYLDVYGAEQLQSEHTSLASWRLPRRSTAERRWHHFNSRHTLTSDPTNYKFTNTAPLYVNSNNCQGYIYI
jgi:hypothetical protein